MKHNLDTRRATALIRRQRDVKYYSRMIKDYSKKEDNEQRKKLIEKFTQKLKLAEKEVTTLKERIVTYE